MILSRGGKAKGVQDKSQSSKGLMKEEIILKNTQNVIDLLEKCLVEMVEYVPVKQVPDATDHEMGNVCSSLKDGFLS